MFGIARNVAVRAATRNTVPETVHDHDGVDVSLTVNVGT
jgi:hypothetical protein